MGVGCCDEAVIVAFGKLLVLVVLIVVCFVGGGCGEHRGGRYGDMNDSCCGAGGSDRDCDINGNDSLVFMTMLGTVTVLMEMAIDM